MSDNLRRYRAIRTALNELYQNSQGNLARHLNTLAAMISGIVGSQRTNFPKMASKVPDGSKPDSREKRFYRWVKNDRIENDLYFLPFAEALICGLALLDTLVLVIDGSVVGRGCICLMVSVIYKKRALPIAWIVVKGNKGHFPEEVHINLVEQVKRLVPENAQVVFLGDGEFDGVNLQKLVTDYKWKYVFRTANNIKISWNGNEFDYIYLFSLIEPGYLIGVPDVLFTNEKYGPVMAICWWREKYKDPVYLVTDMDSAEDACDFYSKRFTIETFFSDQKSRGFNIHKSHLSIPKRLCRLLIAACLAYIWIVYLGALCIKDEWNKIIHRTHRCDLSLFQLGLRLLEHFLNEDLQIPVAFQMTQ